MQSASVPKVIVRMTGGLGNQLFCYAAARRLALANSAELVLDDVSGFARDQLYQRKYALDPFQLTARKATPAERLEPFGLYRRWLKRKLSSMRSFQKRHYVSQEHIDFNPHLLAFKVRGTVYIEGLWQGEGYFKDIEATIRDDLRIKPPLDQENQRMAELIAGKNAVALHVRWFDAPTSAHTHTVSDDYYRRAIGLMEARLDAPHYFLFSDDPEAARARLRLSADRVTCVDHNRGDENAYADLWLMTQCRHFVTANSTFSWWGAWLSAHVDKLVVTPDVTLEGKAAWGFKGLLPEAWIKL